jgi:hypothetical protein
MSNRLFRVMSIALAVEAAFFIWFALFSGGWGWLVPAVLFAAFSVVAAVVARAAGGST